MNSFRKIGILLTLCCVALGVQADDIIITTIEELNTIATNVNSGSNNYSGKTIKLDNDLDYTDKTFTPIGGASGTIRPFAGTFDGQGHTISGISLIGDSRKGVFNLVTGTVCNLTVSDCTFSSTNSAVGGIVAMLTGSGTIENCHTTASVTIMNGTAAGGIVGRCENGNVIACTSAANVGTKDDEKGHTFGGIVGSAGGSPVSPATYVVNVRHCLYYGTSINTVGGHGAIVGLNQTATGLTITLENNFYITSQAGVMGVGYQEKGGLEGTMQNFDETTGYGAVRAHIVTSSDDIADMGDAGAQYDYNGVTPYVYGVKYGGTYYSHVLALEDNADNSTTLSAFNGQTFDVKLRGRRLYRDGNWNTISLPFSVGDNSIFKSQDGCTVMELDITNSYYIKDDPNPSPKSYETGCIDNKLYLFFSRVYKLYAGQPYIVKWTRVDGYNENDPACDYVNPVFRNVTINNTLAPTTSKDGKVTFQPVYDVFQRDYEDHTMLFLGAMNTLYYPSGAGPITVKPCRAYFQLNGMQMADNSSSTGGDEEFIPSSGGDVKAFVMDIESDATSVETLLEKSKSDRCYTLDGRHIDGNRLKVNGSELKSGIYIVNGRKVLVK